MKQSKIFARTFVCGGCDYLLTIQYQEQISPQNQIQSAYERRIKEYAALSDSLTQSQDREAQNHILEQMDALFELIQALKSLKDQKSQPCPSQKSTAREEVAK